MFDRFVIFFDFDKSIQQFLMCMVLSGEILFKNYTSCCKGSFLKFSNLNLVQMSSKSYFNWTETRKYSLAKYALMQHGKRSV